METTSILIDTSVIIKFIRSKNKQKTLLWGLREKYNCYVSVITVFELYNGAQAPEHYEILNKIFKWLNIISLNKEGAIESSNIYKNLIQKNKIIEFRDILIGGTAIINKMSLATINKKHFERINNINLL